MARNLLSKYFWIIDTIRRRRRISRRELTELWLKSDVSEGRALTRRTFYNYREAILDIFGLSIECDNSTFEYYITEEDAHNREVTDWMLNSAAVNDIIAAGRSVASRICLEDVPSARTYLGVIIDALRQNRVIVFDYNNFTRSRPDCDVTLEPYFVRIFHQRWYVIGRNVRENRVKTYALDRMDRVHLSHKTFELPPDVNADDYFRDSFGLVVTRAAAKTITLRVDHVQAKYLRALPLHASQEEFVHDGFSLFRYRMRITDDLVEELMSKADRITVVSPLELRVMLIDRLRRALAPYDENK